MYKKVLLFIISAVFIFGINKTALAMSCHDSAGNSPDPQAAKAGGNSSSSNEAVNIGNKICPVSGEKIDEKLKATYEYQGKIYNFCCAACIDEFKKDPDKYIKKVNEELSRKSESSAR